MGKEQFLSAFHSFDVKKKEEKEGPASFQSDSFATSEHHLDVGDVARK